MKTSSCYFFLKQTLRVALIVALTVATTGVVDAQSRGGRALLKNPFHTKQSRRVAAPRDLASGDLGIELAGGKSADAELTFQSGVSDDVLVNDFVEITDVAPGRAMPMHTAQRAARPARDSQVVQAGLLDRMGGGKRRGGNSCDSGCCDMGGCCDSGCCDANCGCDPCKCCPPWWAHRTSVFGEMLYLTVGDADVNHAQQQNGVGGAGTVPFGLIGRVDPDYEPGFRVGGSKRLTNCSSLFGAYTHYESNAISTLVPPAIPGGGGAVGSFVHHPGAQITASVGPVNAFYDVDFQLGDFGVRRVWKACDCYAINFSLGGRYAHLDQGFLQSGIYAGGSAGQINTRTNVDFDGGGIRFGLDGERRFGRRGFSVYGNANVSPMIGTVQADYTMQNVTNVVQLAQSIWKDDRFITTLDYEAGLAWTSKKGRVRLSAGYNAAHWFNAVTTDSFINGVRANSYADIDGGLSFSGVVGRAEVRF